MKKDKLNHAGDVPVHTELARRDVKRDLTAAYHHLSTLEIALDDLDDSAPRSTGDRTHPVFILLERATGDVLRILDMCNEADAAACRRHLPEDL